MASPFFLGWVLPALINIADLNFQSVTLCWEPLCRGCASGNGSSRARLSSSAFSSPPLLSFFLLFSYGKFLKWLCFVFPLLLRYLDSFSLLRLGDLDQQDQALWSGGVKFGNSPDTPQLDFRCKWLCLSKDCFPTAVPPVVLGQNQHLLNDSCVPWQGFAKQFGIEIFFSRYGKKKTNSTVDLALCCA